MIYSSTVESSPLLWKFPSDSFKITRNDEKNIRFSIKDQRVIDDNDDNDDAKDDDDGDEN